MYLSRSFSRSSSSRNVSRLFSISSSSRDFKIFHPQAISQGHSQDHHPQGILQYIRISHQSLRDQSWSFSRPSSSRDSQDHHPQGILKIIILKSFLRSSCSRDSCPTLRNNYIKINHLPSDLHGSSKLSHFIAFTVLSKYHNLENGDVMTVNV